MAKPLNIWNSVAPQCTQPAASFDAIADRLLLNVKCPIYYIVAEEPNNIEETRNCGRLGRTSAI